MDGARIDRQYRVRAQAVKAEAPAAGRRHRFELAADAVAPRVLHAKHWSIWGQPQPSPSPRLLDHLPLELQLMGISSVLQLAATAVAEVRTFRGDAVGRRLDHARSRRHRHAPLLAPRLRFHGLAR